MVLFFEEYNTYFMACTNFILSGLKNNANRHIIEVSKDFCENVIYTACVIDFV